MIDKGTYVRIRQTVLQPQERSTHLPEETTKVPFKIWVKGYLQEDADLFDIVTIKTPLGHTFTGRLKEANPPYRHTYGDFVPEILKVREIIHTDLWGDSHE
ncbi:2-amino-4-oxopentanoate thiolase subunit OrtA [Candidatus Xianfuyuplasma coldseepsis]|uniref:2-amino-4-ketopentanoate thiolase n=1 Tax=Candidatus Xianfuyuplasma coldseepsis TaxID=2782163 RepID=A0A7L7KSC4_9MOLU|nr:2-amino-4-oxopentanoate thiolase subunit OrtA [Xianfuyuplasma coldseepsis]QMS85162.1 2-amino-4-ketopentanoate thiolase [Xianfuyuplasma coldseepsis]